MRIVRLIVTILIVFAVSYIVIKSDLVKFDYFIQTEFLFTFLGVFIGFALTLYTYITSMFENMQNVIRENYKNDENELNQKLKLFPKLHTEIKDNITFLIYSLVIVVVLSVGEKLIAKLSKHWPEADAVSNSILLCVFILSIFALKDLVSTSFAISDYIIKRNNDKG